MFAEVQSGETTELSTPGQIFAMLFGLAFLCAPGVIAVIRKDADKGRIWAFGLLGPLTIYITWFKALVWALRPAGMSIDEYKLSRLKAKSAINEQKSEIASQKRVKGGTGALKTTIDNGDIVTGPLFLKEHFGFGSISLYKNGYIYIATRMSEPEKLLAISGNTDLAIGQKQHSQMSGAILTVVTEKDAYTIGEHTYAKSDFLTPSTIKSMNKLVATGNALIGK
jgi:hypothetical protein